MAILTVTLLSIIFQCKPLFFLNHCHLRLNFLLIDNGLAMIGFGDGTLYKTA